MKKKLMIIPLVLIVIVTVVILLINNKNNNKEKSILAAYVNYNFKSASTFGGTVIFDDGTVYKWYYSSVRSEYNGYVGSYSINTKDGFTKFILDKAQLSDRTVSKEDLSKINKYIKNINEKDVNCQIDYDNYSTLMIYKKGEWIKINMNDECNTGDNVNELKTLIKSYNKK